MCDCINTIEKKVFEKYKDEKFNNKTVNSANFMDIGFFASGRSKTFSRIGLDLNGQKKKWEINMIHSFCPFCGEKVG